MDSKSLLDIDAARKRLEELDSEREDLSGLLRKLKEIRDTLTSFTEDIEKTKLDHEKWLSTISDKSYEINSKAETANVRFSEAIQSFEKRTEDLFLADSVLACRNVRLCRRRHRTER